MIAADKIPQHLLNGFSPTFLENAEHHTKRLIPAKTFQQTVLTYTECMRNADWAVRLPGSKFELAVLWGLLCEPGLPAELIKSHVHILEEAKDAEIDFLILTEPHYGLLPKTSTRERWAQWDRTAIIADMDRRHPHICNARLYGLHHNEYYNSTKHPKWQPGKGGEEENIRHVNKLCEKFVRLKGAYSVYDPSLNTLIEEIVRCVK